jgi:hypothetical protein
VILSKPMFHSFICVAVTCVLQNVTLVAASSAAAHEAAFFGVPQQSLEEARGRVSGVCKLSSG